MRKFVCLAASVILALGLICPALAVEAYYKDGKVTVSTDDEGFYEIIVDGINVGKWVGTGFHTNTFAMELEPGEHRVRLYSPDGDGGSSTTFIVEDPNQSEEPVPTDKPDDSGKEEQSEGHTHTPKVVPATEPGHGVDGKTEGVTCSVCGQVIQPQKTIPGESHQYAVIKKTDKKVTYECVICGETLELNSGDPVENRFGDIILDENGDPARYTAAPDGKDADMIVLTVNQPVDTAELTLENALIMRTIREGYKVVRVVNGEVVLTVDLYQVTPSWFGEGARIDAYHFTVDSEANLTVQATGAGERLTAESYAGVTAE